jgi:hypothetical protein
MLASSLGQQGLAELLLGDALVGELARLLANGLSIGRTPVSTASNPLQDFATMDDAPIPQVFTSLSAQPTSARLRTRPLDDSAWGDLVEPELNEQLWWNDGDSQ